MKDPLANFIRFGAVVAIFAGALMGFADIYCVNRSIRTV